MFHPTRFLGDTVRLPVDTSSRAFRRARSEPRFPFESVELHAVTLRETPIQLWWSSRKETCHNKVVRSKDGSSPTRSSSEVISKFDPHRAGFGPIPRSTQVRPSPNCIVLDGILGPYPTATRVEGTDDGGISLETEDQDANFPPLTQSGGGGLQSCGP